MSVITPDGGLTGLGYLICALAAFLLFLLGGLIARSSSRRMSTKQLVYCGAAIGLAFITSYFRLFKLPFGGSVTLFSMLFICLIGYWYGVKTGILTGLSYGILQFLQDPYVLSLFQVCCDYIFAFAGLGLAGLFCRSKNGLIKGYLIGVLARGFFHSLGGYLYWMAYMPDNFPKSLEAVYPIVYNYSYLLAEAAITVVILMLPPVYKAMTEVKKSAIS